VGGQHQVGLDRAEVLLGRPDADRSLGEHFGKVDDLDHRRGVLAHARIALGPLAHLLQHDHQVGLQRHLEQHVGAAIAVGRVVEDDVAKHLAVGDHHLDVVGRGDLGEQQVQRLDRALAGGRLDDVAHAIGTEQQDHHPGRHVRQGALQGQADGQRGRAEHGDDRGRLHAQLLQHRHQTDGDHRVAHQRGDEALQGRVGIGAMHPAQSPLGHPGQPAGRPEGDEQDEGGHDQIDGHLAQPVEEMPEHGLVGLDVGDGRKIEVGGYGTGLAHRSLDGAPAPAGQRSAVKVRSNSPSPLAGEGGLAQRGRVRGLSDPSAAKTVRPGEASGV